MDADGDLILMTLILIRLSVSELVLESESSGNCLGCPRGRM
jgi:hypothetical protein